MTLPDLERLPEEEPSPRNGASGTHNNGPDPIVRAAPRRVVHKPMTARRPVEQERKPASVLRFLSRNKKAEATASRPSEEAGLPASEGWEAFPGLNMDGPTYGSEQGSMDTGDSTRQAARRTRNPRGGMNLDREGARRAFWDIAGGLSLLVNAVLIAVLLLMGVRIRELKDTLNFLMQGLYGNFVEMDAASISTTITVDAQIPLNFTLPVQQNTTVQLTEAVPINNTYVFIDTPIIDINGPARVTLPAGTNLPIALTMDIPVQAVIPISLQVPVNIPLNQTQLHGPFQGLQNTIKPLYCTFNQNAQYPEGVYICDEHDAPTPVPGLP